MTKCLVEWKSGIGGSSAGTRAIALRVSRRRINSAHARPTCVARPFGSRRTKSSTGPCATHSKDVFPRWHRLHRRRCCSRLVSLNSTRILRHYTDGLDAGCPGSTPRIFLPRRYESRHPQRHRSGTASRARVDLPATTGPTIRQGMTCGYVAGPRPARFGRDRRRDCLVEIQTAAAVISSGLASGRHRRP